ncbi:hypothetical protein HDE_06394 [Halotydeus destructor]|nr:hypothetical protein HDE_06394 [Halotydeus destructor]
MCCIQTKPSSSSSSSPSSASSSPSIVSRENGNELVDTVLKLLKPKYKLPMKPIKLGNRTIGLDEQFGALKLIAAVRILSGYVNQIGDLIRTGDAYISEYDDDSSLIEMKVGVLDIKFNATIAIDVMGIQQKETIIGSVGTFGIEFDVLTNATTGGRKTNNVKVFEISDLDLKVDAAENDVVRRIQNLNLHFGLQILMNTNLKKIVNSIVSIAASDIIARIAGSM